MKFSFTKSAAIAAAAAAAAVALAGTAQAQTPCTGTNPTCDVTGTVTVATTMTVTLDNTSFTIAANPGHGLSTGGTGTADPGSDPLGTVPSSYAVNASVVTNNAGYELTESLGSTSPTGGTTAFQGTSHGGYLGAGGGTTYAWSYPASDATVGAGGAFSQTWAAGPAAGGLGTPVVNQAGTSGPSGDTWGLGWGWDVPAHQAPDSYAGYISVIGLA